MGKARLLTDRNFYNERPTRNEIVRYKAGRRRLNKQLTELRYKTRKRIRTYHFTNKVLGMLVGWVANIGITAYEVKKDTQEKIEMVKKIYYEKKK